MEQIPNRSRSYLRQPAIRVRNFKHSYGRGAGLVDTDRRSWVHTVEIGRNIGICVLPPEKDFDPQRRRWFVSMPKQDREILHFVVMRRE